MIEEIKAQLEEFKAFKEHIERSQLDYPVDEKSKSILLDHAVIFDRTIGYGVSQPVNLSSPFDEATEIVSDKKKFLLETTGFVVIGG